MEQYKGNGMNFNPHRTSTGIPPEQYPISPYSPFKNFPNCDILDELRSLLNYSEQSQRARALLLELLARTEKSFGNSPILSKELHKDGFLYTSLIRNNEVLHFVVDDLNTKSLIERIFYESDIELLKDPGELAKKFGERHQKLMDLGDKVFRVVRTDVTGKQLEESIEQVGFQALLIWETGFNLKPEHFSKYLPVFALEMPLYALGHIAPDDVGRIILYHPLVKEIISSSARLDAYSALQKILEPIALGNDIKNFVNKFNIPLSEGGYVPPQLVQLQLFFKEGVWSIEFAKELKDLPSDPVFINRNDYPGLVMDHFPSPLQGAAFNNAFY